jgi:hypothetical protein
MPILRFPALHALPVVALVCASVVPACGSDPTGGPGPRIGETQSALTEAERMARYATIRDDCTAGGIFGKGYLFAGIAFAETGLAMCWSEASWACKGPNSPDCANGPVIAGSADGPCSDEQGGLGMFQFDAGTYADTLSAYGSDILTIDGQVSHAIDFVIHIVKISNYTTNAETDAKAKQWINDFDINNGTLRDQWIKTVVNYYNGCPPSGSCWASRYQSYNDGLQQVLDETGLPFWEGTFDWKASYVAQSFPLANQPFALYPSQEETGYLDLKNEGKNRWEPGEVFLGTTQPRDMSSPLVGPDWVSPSRAATVDKSTATGSTGRFIFTVKAPEAPGDYPQFFNLVREGVHWFSDSGQGGPPDNQLQVKVTVQPSLCAPGFGPTPTCDAGDIATCDPATGKVSKTPCSGVCVAKSTGAQCDTSPDAGGDGGKAGAAGYGTAGGLWVMSDQPAVEGGCLVAHRPVDERGGMAVAIAGFAAFVRRRKRAAWGAG